MPLTLGLRRLVRALRARDQEDPAQAAPAAGLASVVGVTIANGGDNIAGYAPAFRVIGAGGTAITVAVFAAGIALWCLAGSRLVAYRSVIAAVQRCGRWLVPVIFILIGVTVLIKTGVLGRIL